MPIPHSCRICRQAHDDWPALTFPSPAAYYTLREAEQAERASLDSDFCVIIHPEQTDRFVRAVLLQDVKDHPEPLHYGLWTSLSAASFADYRAHYRTNNHRTTYFGWLANPLPDYDFEVNIPLRVITRPNKQRPELVPQEGFDHPFVRDYYAGIPLAEAQRRIHAIPSD